MTLLWLQGGGLREEDRGDAQRQRGDEWWMQKETMRDGTSKTQRTEMLQTATCGRQMSMPLKCVPPGTERITVKVSLRYV